MAVPTFDTSKSGSFSGTSGSDSITVGSNSNRVLIVGVFGYAGVSNDPRTSGASVTVGGVAMTYVDSVSVDNATAGGGATLIFKAPATGSVTVAFSGFENTGLAWKYVIYSYYNVDQGTQPDNHGVSKSQGSTSNTVSITPTTAGCLLWGATTVENTTMTAATGIPNNQITLTGSASSVGAIAGDNGAVAASSQTVTGSWSGSHANSVFVISLKAAVVVNTAALADSIMNSASRLATVDRIAAFVRTSSVSIMNSASRFATVVRGFSYAVSLSSSMMNSSSRFATVTYRLWLKISKNVSAWTGPVGNSSSWSNAAKNASTFSDIPKTP